jgi:hypothetical protein
MGMAEDADKLRSKIESQAREPGLFDGLRAKSKAKSEEREQRKNEEGLLIWDAIDDAVKEFVPLARQQRDLPTRGIVKKYWQIAVGARVDVVDLIALDPGFATDIHLRVFRDATWKLGTVSSAKRAPMRSLKSYEAGRGAIAVIRISGGPSEHLRRPAGPTTRRLVCAGCAPAAAARLRATTDGPSSRSPHGPRRDAARPRHARNPWQGCLVA